MTAGPVLLAILLAAIGFIVWSTARWRWHPFLALIVTAYAIGLAAQMPALEVAKTIAVGFGELMTSIGLVIVAGTIIGVMLERSGAAVVMAEAILRLVGPRRPGLAMSLIGYVVSIPVFCDSGFVILAALNKALARRTGVSLTALAIALSTGLYATHTMVPPTPGPLAAAANLHATNLGLVIVVGLLCAIPPMLAGYLWSRRFARHFDPGQRFGEQGDPGAEWERMKAQYGRLPPAWTAFAPLVTPILLIALASVAAFPSAPLGTGWVQTALRFLGTPFTALLIGLALCFPLVRGRMAEARSGWISDALKDAAAILVVTGAGGSLGKMLGATHISDYLAAALAQAHLGVFLPFAIAAAIKTAQGSSTVAMVTTSAIVQPMLAALGFDGEFGRTLMVMAVAAGSMVVSHANDSYFWVVSQFSHMEVSTAYRAQTVGTLIQGLAGILTVAALSILV
ncbi:MAG: GntP family permease [Planctomycetota bacterium]|nr:GntP family permease [Planctomycetota bacterium]